MSDQPGQQIKAEGSSDAARGFFWITLTILGVMVVLGGLAFPMFLSWLGAEVQEQTLAALKAAGSKEPEAAFVPVSPEDLLVDRFMRRVNTGGQGADDLLGPAAAFDEQPISEAEADVRTANFYLRHADLKIVSIRRGEVVGGKKVQTAGRYTLATTVKGSTPPFRVRDQKGNVEPASRMFMLNPDLVVDVKDGKIHPMRAQLHND